MVFSSLVFLFHFLPLFLLLYYICPAKWKNAVLFAGSLIFYIYGVKNEPWYFFLFLLSVLVNYHIGLLLGRRRWLEHRKKWLIFCVNNFWPTWPRPRRRRCWWRSRAPRVRFSTPPAGNAITIWWRACR